jgi:Secretion system C-terminal sorting domain
MKKVVLLIFLYTSNIIFAQSTTYQWSKGFGGDNDFAKMGNTAVDNQGNVFTCGIFKGTKDFDPGIGVANLTASGRNYDIFICKLNSLGNYEWAYKFGASFAEDKCSLALDNSGNVYVTGNMLGTIDFDPGAGIVNLSPSSPGNSNTFILKLTNNGLFSWVKQLTGGENIPQSLKIDNANNIVLVGKKFLGTTDFDPSAGVENSLTTTSLFYVKLNTNGDFLWAKSINQNFNIDFYDVAFDSLNNIYFTGTVNQGPTDFDPSTALFELTVPIEGVFVLKNTSDGDFVWVKAISCNNPIVPESIAVDSNNNVFISGNFQGTADFDPSAAVYNLVSNVPTGAGSPAKHIFVEKLNSDGSFAWVNRTGQILNEFDSGYNINYNSGSVLAGKMALDSSGNVIQSGTFQGNFNFGTINTFSEFCQNCGNVQYPRSKDIFLTQIDTNGINIWVTNYSSYSANANTLLHDLTVDSQNNIYLHGQTVYPTDFDSTQVGNEFQPATNAVFVVKFNRQTLALSQNLLFNNLSIYPNPSSGNFNIQIEENLINANVSVYNMLGQKIKSFKLDNSITNQYLNSGTYILEVEKDGNKTSRKLIVN